VGRGPSGALGGPVGLPHGRGRGLPRDRRGWRSSASLGRTKPQGGHPHVQWNPQETLPAGTQEPQEDGRLLKRGRKQLGRVSGAAVRRGIGR